MQVSLNKMSNYSHTFGYVSLDLVTLGTAIKATLPLQYVLLYYGTKKVRGYCTMYMNKKSTRSLTFLLFVFVSALCMYYVPRMYVRMYVRTYGMYCTVQSTVQSGTRNRIHNLML